MWGIPYSEQYCFRPKEEARPQINGTLPARIESRETHDTYAHLDRQGRYRVKLDFSREDAEPGFNSLWIRQAKPYSGDTFGWHTALIDGTEVAIAYSNGDIDRPYIAHAFHDSAHQDVVTRENRSQNILRTPADNELRMEDRRGEEHIALTTPFGGTELNQGHIVDAQEKARGSGFELRTDEYGVIRVAKGLFITAGGQQKAAGEVLDMATALKEIGVCRHQLQALAAAAEQAQALEADIASQIAMFDKRLKPLNEMIHVYGPQGVAFTSGEHMQLTAAENIAINAGGDISSGAMGNTAILAGEQTGLFARAGKLSLNASEGPVQIQAQNGEMHISAEQKLSLISAADMLFAGRKKVTLTGGGSYLIIEGGKIEYGTDTTYTRKIRRTATTGSISMDANLPEMPSILPALSCGPNSACFRVSDVLTGTEDTEFAYQILTPTGTVQGRTDSALTYAVNSDAEENVILDYVYQLKAGTKWQYHQRLPQKNRDSRKRRSVWSFSILT